MKKITVKEIAKMADVSITTVSFVLNNKPGISDAVRKKVQDIIDETHFKPNLNSKKLLKNKSYNICLIINANASPFEDLFYFDVARGILNQSIKYEYNLIMSKTANENPDLPNIVYSGDVDGLIFLQDIEEDLLKKTLKTEIPFVVVDSHKNASDITSVNSDYCVAAYDAANYLINMGHRDIVMIGNSTVSDFFKQTYSGFKNAMDKHGLSIRENQEDIAVSNEDEAYKIASKLLTSKKTPSALLCTADIFAVGAIRAAKDCGLSVPDDVSVMGIDDIFLSKYIEPELTTMSINKEDMGVHAMDLLYRKISGQNPSNIFLPMSLVERNSVAKLT